MSEALDGRPGPRYGTGQTLSRQLCLAAPRGPVAATSPLLSSCRIIHRERSVTSGGSKGRAVTALPTR
ncbi:hypothetical protein [Streptomyces sp. NBC_00344]|uniref:hypothetical protein n=1 Tax=Streptomyces sp. NBC_00344 TaxID=2975720 RepID=UPI002E1DFCEE